MPTQRIIWPWETKKWPEVKYKITDKIHSIVDMDSRIASMYSNKLRPRLITELFNIYYSDEQYATDRIPQDIFIEQIIPHMQSLIEAAPKTFRAFNAGVLVQSNNIALNRPQIATIMACIWFGLFDYNYLTSGEYKIEDFPEPTFINVFLSQNIFAFQCLINYFARVFQYMNSTDKNVRDLFNAGIIILARNHLSESPDWVNSDTPISEIYIGEGTPDDAPTKMHTAYAHEFIGGDLFSRALTQEEVILLVRPECIVATLFCARLVDDCAQIVIGAEKMSQYVGYGSSIKFLSNFVDKTSKGYSSDDTEVMTQCAVVFIDAASRTSGLSQYIHDFQRDLDKAYCGFNSLKFSKHGIQVASGNWTYGFNGNNMQIKFLQQVLAASQADKCLVYYPFGKDFEDKIIPFIDWIARNNFTVGTLFQAYLRLIQGYYHSNHTSRLSDIDIFTGLLES